MITPERFTRMVRAAADLCGCSPGDVLGSGRTTPMVRARQFVGLLCRDAGASYPEIAALFGKRGHSGIFKSTENILRDIEAMIGKAAA